MYIIDSVERYLNCLVTVNNVIGTIRLTLNGKLNFFTWYYKNSVIHIFCYEYRIKVTNLFSEYVIKLVTHQIMFIKKRRMLFIFYLNTIMIRIFTYWNVVWEHLMEIQIVYLVLSLKSAITVLSKKPIV